MFKGSCNFRQIIVLYSIIYFSIVANFFFDRIKNKPTYVEIVYEVKQGDTLWELGLIYADEDTDIREWIDRVKYINGMKESGIETGKDIIILKEKK